MARTVSLLRTLARQHWQERPDAEATLTAILADTNAALYEGNDSALFVTLFVAIADPAIGRLSYACAGHPAPYLCTTEAVQALAAPAGLPVGLMPDYLAGVNTVTLPVQSCLLAFSDGVTEAISAAGELFGHARLEALLGTCSDRTPAGLLAAVGAGIAQFAGDAEQSDDIALLAFAPAAAS
jgi:sigma-B regulation protein RsbU (phosphoserine phosphatase)